MAVLVTGLGYLGAALAEQVLRQGETVVAIENRFSTDDAALDRLAGAGVRLIPGDVADPAVVARAFALAPVATVYHFAAQASGHPDAASAEYTERTNLQGPRVLLDAMLHHGARDIVFASSLKVYGDNPSGVVGEDHPYGCQRDLSHLSKIYVEKLLELYAARHGLRCLALRYGVVYGLGPVFKTDERFMTVPNKFARRAARGEPLTVHGGGRTAVGFVHLADAVRATLAAAGHPGFAGYTPLNVNGEVATLANLARLVVAAGAARGLAVAVEGLTASDGADTPGFTVTSGLDAVPFRYERTLRDGVGEVLDACHAGESGARG